MKAKWLAGKVRKWFADGIDKNRDLGYRFKGKESRLFCHNFGSIVENLKTDSDQQSHTCTFLLHVFGYTANYVEANASPGKIPRYVPSLQMTLRLQHFISNATIKTHYQHFLFLNYI